MHFRTQVDQDGNLPQLHTNLPAGTEVEVIIDLTTAAPRESLEEDAWLNLAASSMDFWDNPVDDEVWNNA